MKVDLDELEHDLGRETVVLVLPPWRYIEGGSLRDRLDRIIAELRECREAENEKEET